MSEQQTDVIIGNVKWFNNKSGFGFITALNKEVKGQDIFVHHTSIDAKGDLYKYLVQGEYVEFKVQKVEDKSHENQATNIRGIMSGDLMCETRHKNKTVNSNDTRDSEKRRQPRRTHNNHKSSD